MIEYHGLVGYDECGMDRRGGIRTTRNGWAASRWRSGGQGWRAVFGFLVVMTVGAIPGWAHRTTALKPLPLNLSGQSVNPLNVKQPAATVLIFIRTDCPISSRYAPEIQHIEAEFASRGVVFWLVDPDPTESSSTIRRYLKQYGYADAGHVLRDPAHVLVQQTGVTVTPEAAVFTGTGQMEYRGRIDNWYVRLGRYRPSPTTHDLQAALAAILAVRPVARKTTPAFGCFIADMQ
ncbi:MAG: hypothetical protein ACREP9_18630 [Candidatus Dormibacteraceae bacterium]